MINILVVIYNKSFSESRTLVEIGEVAKTGLLKPLKLLIWDNSPVKINEIELEQLKGYLQDITVIHTPENLPLSKIYNRVIDHHINRDDYLMLLDHDTFVTEKYFTEIIDKINCQDLPDLLLPKIWVNGNIESPALQYVLFAKRWKEDLPGYYDTKHVTAINSGMVISARFFSSGFRYDERLLFYGTDTYMMYKYSGDNKKFYLLDTSLKHDLNLLSNPSVTQKAKVFRAIKQANLIVYSSSRWYSVLTRINNLIIAVKYAVKYRSLIFFK